MNQRAHIRHQVDMPAELSFGDLAARQCQVQDFCLGGLMLALAEPEDGLLQAVDIGDQVSLSLEVQGLRGLRRITLGARVQRKEGVSLGLAFENPEAADLLALQNHVRSLVHEHRSSPSRKAGVSREVVERALGELETVVKRFCGAGMERFLPAARDALMEAADKATTNQEQHPWFEAWKILSRQAESLVRNFTQKAIRKTENLALGLASEARDEDGPGNPRLALVDKDMFEDWLTLKVMATRAETRCHEELLHLQLRLDELCGISLSARRNPVHPAVICNAFGEALRLLPLKQKTDRVILAAFDDTLVSRLPDLYAEVNSSLAGLGVLPDLDVGRYISERYGRSPAPPKPATPPTPPTPATGAAAPAGAAPAEPEPRGAQARQAQRRPGPRAAGDTQALASRQFALQQHIARHAYDTVRKLLSARSLDSARARHAGTAPASMAPVDEARVAGALVQLQHAPALAPDAPLVEQVRQAVDQAGEQPVPGMDQELLAAVEVIQHLFDGIASNPALTPRVQGAIRRLQVPFLRLLLMDDSFLAREQHPARQMLNRMAHLGVRGSANVQAHEEEIDREVAVILEKFESDINVFEQSLEKLDKMAGRQQSLYARNIRRVTDACEGKQKLVQARREVDRALERRIGGRRVPRAALSLIDAGWRQLLVQSLLRGGRDSREWHEYLGVIDQLLRAIARIPTREELAALLASIKAGLGQVDHTQMQNARLISDLRDLLSRKAREQAEPELVEVPAGVVGAEEDLVETGDEVLQRWLRRARQYEVGDWFTHFDKGQEFMLRLAWVDPDRQTFVFVNHQGMKIVEHRVDAFAAQLSRGEMRPIDNLDAPAVDRGLESMVQRVYDQMAYQATHDELTSLFNRREFERQLRQRLGKDAAAQGTLAHIDIDQFKVVNNFGGPEAGDELITRMASLLRDSFPGQLVARVGGDEFALWLEQMSEATARKAIEGFARQVAEARFTCGGRAFSVTISCGLVPRQGATTASELLRGASSACLSAKEAGRNRVHSYAPDDKELSRRDDIMGWVTRLNEAIDRDHLLLRCQRIEATVAGEHPPAFEILISIAGEHGEFLAPAEFLHAAERYNRMHALDRWVLRNVLKWMHENPAVVEQVDHFSVNLSGHSLNDASLLEFLYDQFEEFPVRRDKLCFEVTETAAIANLEDAVDFIRELQKIGCRFSLDDFGSGLASYGHLKHLPVDYIKIDGTFIRDVADDPADRALVRSINEMGHLMGKRTIAEYVENDRIRECLREIGVDYVQGYGVEEPRPLASLADAVL